MLDPDLDLEADLSIDSIKRIEIVGELADRVGLPGMDGGAAGTTVDEAVVEELAQLKTLRSIVAWLDDHDPEASPTSAVPAAAPAPPEPGQLAPPSSRRSGAPAEPTSRNAQPAGARPAPTAVGTGRLTARSSVAAATAAARTRGTARATSAGTEPAAPVGQAQVGGHAPTAHARRGPTVASGQRESRDPSTAPGHEATVARNIAAVAAQATTSQRESRDPTTATGHETTVARTVAGQQDSRPSTADRNHEATMARNPAAAGGPSGSAGAPQGATATRRSGAAARATAGPGDGRERKSNGGGEDRSGRVPAAARRFVLETAMLAPALPVASVAGKTIAVISGPWDGLDELRARIERAGATVEIIAPHRGTPGRRLPQATAALLAEVDGVVHMGAADTTAPMDARDVFAALQPAIVGRATTLVAAVGPRRRGNGGGVTGVPGLMRAVARELPEHHVRAVEVADQAPSVVARLLADEVLDPAGPASVTYVDGTRTTRRVAKGSPLGRDLPTLPLDDSSVVVLTGGARGITARAAIALAKATGCRLELLGRSPLPSSDEDPRTAGALDRPALRQALITIGELRAPADIEAACDRILAAREVRSTLRALSELGVPATYHTVDARDAAALAAVLADVRRRHGHIDAVIHGAGVLDDRLARDKTHAGFDRVFATKVDAAGHLLDQLDEDVRLVVFFGSVSGVFGNRGQVDYSAANDALDELAARFDGVDGRRVISIDWGPWGGTGMVSPELEREYARRGVGLIDPDEGVRALLTEMATLPGEPAQVVVMRAEPEALDGRPPLAPGTWTPTDLEIDELTDPAESADHVTLEDLTERG
jgi:hypothetical protein